MTHIKSMRPDTAVTRLDGRHVDVSIVIPSYNHALFIEAAVNSVLAQSFNRWELIVVDDGSTDSSREILERQYQGHPRIKLIYQFNQGAHHAINRGIENASGRYISILNSDDVYHPDRLQILWTHCQERSCDMAFTPVTAIDDQGEPIESSHPWNRLYNRLTNEYKELGSRSALVTGNFTITTSNFFFRADLVRRIGGFTKKRYNHDWDFLVRLVRNGHEIICVGQYPLLSYRIHNSNTITQNTLMARLELKRILHDLVPTDDKYFAHLVSRVELNMRSIRREHESRMLQKIIHEHQNQIQEITASRAYKFSKFLSDAFRFFVK